MKQLRRNTEPFEYLPWSGGESDLNTYGQHTGNYYPLYSTPVSYRGSFSIPSGNANQTLFGLDIRYTHVLVMDDPKADIAETGLVRRENGKTYEIRAVRPSLNALSIALRERTANHGEPYPVITGVTGETGETGATGGDGT